MQSFRTKLNNSNYIRIFRTAQDFSDFINLFQTYIEDYLTVVKSFQLPSEI